MDHLLEDLVVQVLVQILVQAQVQVQVQVQVQDLLAHHHHPLLHKNLKPKHILKGLALLHMLLALVQLEDVSLDLYIYGLKEEGDFGHGSFVWIEDPFLVGDGTDVGGFTSEWIYDK